MLRFECGRVAGSRGMIGHGHETPHLLVVVEGDVDEFDGRQTHPMRRGSFRLSGANVRHDLWIGAGGANCLMVEARGEFWTRVLSRGVHGDERGAFGKTSAASMLAEIDSAESIARSPSALQALGRMIATEARHQDEAPAWLGEALHHLDTGKATSLSRMAATLSRDRVHLTRAFGAWLGFRPIEYRAIRRAAATVDDIGKSDAPLADIALAHGYAHQSHMNRALKDLFGHPPAHWRKPTIFRAISSHRAPLNERSTERIGAA